MKKELIHATKSCGGVYKIGYNADNIPLLTCLKCDKVIDDWVKWQETYKYYWEDSQKWEDKKDHMVVLLGYFCAIYRNYYGIDYVLSLNESGLFSGAEMNVLRKTYRALESNPNIVKKYIDFLFQSKVTRRKKKITSISYIATPALIQEFKFTLEKEKHVTRDTPIPVKVLDWVKIRAPNVLSMTSLNDYGDLKSFLALYKIHGVNDPDADVFINKLKENKLIDDAYLINNWRD